MLTDRRISGIAYDRSCRGSSTAKSKSFRTGTTRGFPAGCFGKAGRMQQLIGSFQRHR